MSRQDDLGKADRDIKDLEIRFNTGKAALINVDVEIEDLEAARRALESNMRFLKKKGIIAMAVEYKKAREDLAKTKARLTVLNNDRINIEKACQQLESGLQAAKDFHNKLLNDADNVVHGNFGRKTDG